MSFNQSKTLLPTLYISHGGGPCFFMDWSNMGPADTWDKMAKWLKGIPQSIGSEPRAIVVISAHWEEQEVTIMSQEHPQLLFDYFGFPKHTYELTYPAPSSPSLAREIQELLTQKGIISKIDSKRGYDHGVFVPFKLIYPEAQIPIVQVSLKRSLNPQDHLELGKALAPLRDEGVLIVGSGMSYHNLREFFGGNSVGRVSDEFDAWLTESVTANDPDFRNERLLSWKEAPSAKLAHPREEHLIPLLVVAGAAGTDLGSRIFVDRVMGATISAYQFGE